jgi:hypothetical protein
MTSVTDTGTVYQQVFFELRGGLIKKKKFYLVLIRNYNLFFFFIYTGTRY